MKDLLESVVPERPRSILFTSFEPSGDDHASAVIKILRAQYPDLRIFAWGGPKMKAAGAEIVESTGQNAVIGIPGLSKILEHRAINQRVNLWLLQNKISVHVPVDSPAANFPICTLAKRHGCKVVHLIAPQLWAWGGKLRIRKLRRLTDLVLCVLPFEEEWFRARGVATRFVGHPILDEPLDFDQLDENKASLPHGDDKVALMPGSRPSEIKKNFPVLLDAYHRLAEERPNIVGIIAATNEQTSQRMREIAQTLGGWPDSLEIVHSQTDTVIHWCNVAMVVSGTVTLQIARQHKPMVIVYKADPVMWALVGSWIFTTKFFTLPNLIADRAIVPELVPHFSDGETMFKLTRELLDSAEAYQTQADELSGVVQAFKGRHAAKAAAQAIAQLAELGEPEPQVL